MCVCVGGCRTDRPMAAAWIPKPSEHTTTITPAHTHVTYLGALERHREGGGEGRGGLHGGESHLAAGVRLGKAEDPAGLFFWVWVG